MQLKYQVKAKDISFNFLPFKSMIDYKYIYSHSTNCTKLIYLKSDYFRLEANKNFSLVDDFYLSFYRIKKY